LLLGDGERRWNSFCHFDDHLPRAVDQPLFRIAPLLVLLVPRKPPIIDNTSKPPIAPDQEAPEAPSSLKKRRVISESSTSEDNDSVVSKGTDEPPPPPSVPSAAVFNPYTKMAINPSLDLASVAVFIRKGAVYKDQDYIANLRTTNFKSKGNLDSTEW
jgi:hypothetical protein